MILTTASTKNSTNRSPVAVNNLHVNNNPNPNPTTTTTTNNQHNSNQRISNRNRNNSSTTSPDESNNRSRRINQQITTTISRINSNTNNQTSTNGSTTNNYLKRKSSSTNGNNKNKNVNNKSENNNTSFTSKTLSRFFSWMILPCFVNSSNNQNNSSSPEISKKKILPKSNNENSTATITTETTNNSNNSITNTAPVTTSTTNQLQLKNLQQVPIGRCHHSSIVYNGKMYVFGGYGGVGVYFNDIEVLDLNFLSWSKCEVSGGAPPSVRRSHSASLIKSKIFIFGGRYCNTYYNDFYSFDIETNQWQQLKMIGDIPSPRAGHSSFSIGNKLIIFGGERYEIEKQESVLFQDLFILDTDTMVCRQILTNISSFPPPRVYHSFTLLEHKKCAVLFGGMGNNLKRLDDVWVLEGLFSNGQMENSLHWKKIETTGCLPHAHETHTATAIGNLIYVIGGKENIELRYFENFILTLDIDLMKWTKYMTKVPQRGRHSAVLHNGKIIIHGGGDNSISFLNETRILDVGNYQQSIASLFTTDFTEPSYLNIKTEPISSYYQHSFDNTEQYRARFLSSYEV